MPYRILLALLFTAGLGAAGCAASATQPCVSGADCDSGVCNADGTCGSADTSTSTGTSSATGTGTGGGSTTGTSTGTGTGSGGSGGGSVCSPNNDGAIDRAEVPLAAGLHATFEAAENATVDTAGKTQGDGSRDWDLSAMLPGDHGELVETLPLDNEWFAKDFAGATYASKLSDTQDLLGVFQITDSALLLLGVASPTQSLTQTEVKYNPPVTVLAFPLKSDATWSTTSMVSGQTSGVFGVYAEAYQSKVDAHGTLKTPFGSFPVLRVRTDLTRTVGAVVTTLHTFAFVTECFGTVATVTSQNYEPMGEFTNAAEVARLTP
jgi:hypothetical protein